MYLPIHFLIDDEVLALFPVARLHGLRRSHHMFPHVLGGARKRLPLAHPHHVVEVLTNHTPTGVKLMCCNRHKARMTLVNIL